MLTRLDELAQDRADFAFETTLSSRTFAPWLKKQQAVGYEFHLYYFCLPSAERSIQRVAFRVRAGGHHVPDDDVRRRYERSRRNFVELYMPLANAWEFFDNSDRKLKRVACGGCDKPTTVFDEPIWKSLIQDHE